VELETEVASKDVISQIAGCSGLFKSRLETLIGSKDLTVDIVVANACT